MLGVINVEKGAVIQPRRERQHGLSCARINGRGRRVGTSRAMRGEGGASHSIVQDFCRIILKKRPPPSQWRKKTGQRGGAG